MMIRSWRDVRPQVGHESKIMWSIFQPTGTPNDAGACLQGLGSLTLHRLQPGMEGDYHDHDDKEQVYYFLSGSARMKIDGDMYDVREGDAVQLPPKCMHQILNHSDDWVEHLIITAMVD